MQRKLNELRVYQKDLSNQIFLGRIRDDDSVPGEECELTIEIGRYNDLGEIKRLSIPFSDFSEKLTTFGDLERFIAVRSELWTTYTPYE